MTEQLHHQGEIVIEKQQKQRRGAAGDSQSLTCFNAHSDGASNTLAAVFMMEMAAAWNDIADTSSRDDNDFVHSHIQSGHTVTPSSSSARYALLAPWHIKDLCQ